MGGKGGRGAERGRGGREWVGRKNRGKREWAPGGKCRCTGGPGEPIMSRVLNPSVLAGLRMVREALLLSEAECGRCKRLCFLRRVLAIILSWRRRAS